ncbi:hypothetical protein KM043_008483 [Ampulex compressa]|nr:hypothetical protein KM043_008483 [Ampulex compressa]
MANEKMEKKSVNASAKMLEGNEENSYQRLELKVYKRRWLMLGLYILCSGGSTCQWIQYSIISNIVTRYYNVSSLAVDWTAMSFMGYYVILVFPATYVADRCGLRWTAIVASGFSCLGAWVKVCSVEPHKFYITFIGQSLVAWTQTLILTLPGRLAAQWFDSAELSTATSLGIFGSQLGIAFGFLFTPMIVKNHENLEDIGADLSYLFWCVAIITSVAFGLVVILFEDEPRLAPSETRALQKIKRMESEEGFVAPIKRLFKNKYYVLLCNSYGLNVGVLNAMATLLNQLFLAHFENGEEDAGRIGLAMIITGMFGSVSFGIILDKTHRYKETTVVVYLLTFCGQMLFAVVTFLEVKWMVYLSAIFHGYFMSGYVALGYEICAEYTYPESEGIASGVLNVTNNVYGIILVIIFGRVLQSYGDIPVHAGLCLALLVGSVITVMTKDVQRRQTARKRARLEGDVDNVGDDTIEIPDD